MGKSIGKRDMQGRTTDPAGERSRATEKELLEENYLTSGIIEILFTEDSKRKKKSQILVWGREQGDLRWGIVKGLAEQRFYSGKKSMKSV